MTQRSASPAKTRAPSAKTVSAKTGSAKSASAKAAQPATRPRAKPVAAPRPTRTAALISLGCSKNLADSEDLVTALRSVDFGLTKDLADESLSRCPYT